MHRVPQDYTPGEPRNVVAWQAWFASMGANRADPGSAVIQTSFLCNLGEGTRIGGYLVLTADNLDAALSVANGCPSLGLGGGIEVGLIAIPPSAGYVNGT